MVNQKIVLRKPIIFLAVITSIILYFAGVLSGLYANKLIKEETKNDITTLKKETEDYLKSLQTYVDFLDTNSKSLQLEQLFIETLNQEQMCQFLSISLNEISEQLGYFWDKLPARIEEYERNNKPTEEYLTLKDQYAIVSIRTWLIAKTQFDKCNTSIVQGLYFYSRDCTKCVEQGKEIDRLNNKVMSSGKDLILFPLDINSNQTIIKNLKKYYKINSTPAIILNDKVFQGKLFNAEELLQKSETIK